MSESGRARSGVVADYDDSWSMRYLITGDPSYLEPYDAAAFRLWGGPAEVAR